MPTVTLPDGTEIEFPAGMSALEIQGALLPHTPAGEWVGALTDPKSLRPYREIAKPYIQFAEELIKDVIPVSSQARSVDRIDEMMEKFGSKSPIGKVLSGAEMALEGAGMGADIVPGLKLAGAAGASLLPLMMRKGGQEAPGVMRSQSGIIGHHGSPHKFDKFDHSKMGTGEGAQAYGWGTYIAENPGVAGSYQKASLPFNPPKYKEFDITPNRGRGIGQAYDYQEINGNFYKGNSLVDEIEYKQAFQKASDNYDKLASQGNLYEVDLPDEKISQMLDWDAPLSEQPESVRKILGDIVERTKQSFPNIRPDEMTGGQLYQAYVGHRGGTSQFASETLQQQGIPGIKYFDGSSRSAGEGTRNFVVFDESDMTILKRNGEDLN